MTPDIQELKRLAEASHNIYSGEAWFSYKEIMIRLRPVDEEDAAYIAAASPSTILALIEVAEAAQKLVSAVDDLIAESHGVYGLHQNGDIAPWDTLIEGGQFEYWLLPLSGARTALEGVKK